MKTVPKTETANGKPNVPEPSKPLQQWTNERHPAASLKIDPRVQGQLRGTRVKEILKRGLDLDELGTFLVSRRSNGDLVNLDGQHRRAALIEEDMGEWEVDCKVFEGLSLAEEAKKYRVVNMHRTPSAIDDFLAAITQGDPDSVGISAVVHHAGFEVGYNVSATTIRCVKALRVVWKMRDGEEAMRRALSTIVAAWGHAPSAVEGHVVEGLGLVFSIYGPQVDQAVLVAKLAKFNGGPAGLLGRARTIREIHKVTIAQGVMQCIVSAYNSGRRAHRLGDA